MSGGQQPTRETDTIPTENGGHLQVTATPGGVTIEQQGVGRVSLIHLDRTSAGRLAEQLELAILGREEDK